MKVRIAIFGLMIGVAVTALSRTAFGQVSNPSIIPVAAAPSGSCSEGLPNQQVISTGAQYSCQSGTWGPLGAGSGGVITASPQSSLCYFDLAGTQAHCKGDSGITTDGSGNLKSVSLIGNVNSQINPMASPYNAKCDGVTDDTAALQAASAAGSLFIPAGKICEVDSGTIDVAGQGSTNRKYMTLGGTGTIQCKPSTTQTACVRVANGSNTVIGGVTILCDPTHVTYCLDIDIGSGTSNENTLVLAKYITGGHYGIAIGPTTTLDVSHVTIIGTQIVSSSVAGIISGDGTQGNVLDNACFGCTVDTSPIGIIWNGGGFNWFNGGTDENTTVDFEMLVPSDQKVTVFGERSEGSNQFLLANTGTNSSTSGITLEGVNWFSSASPATYAVQDNQSGSLLIENSHFFSSGNAVNMSVGNAVVPTPFSLINVGVANPSWTTILKSFASSANVQFFSTGDYTIDPTTQAVIKGSGEVFSSASSIANLNIPANAVTLTGSDPNLAEIFTNTDAGGRSWQLINTATGGVTTAGDLCWWNGTACAQKLNATGDTTIKNHLNQLNGNAFAGTCTMSAGTSCTATLSAAFNFTPICIATQQAGVVTGGAVGCQVSGTTVTITAAVANSETWGYMVIGNPN